MYYYHNIDPVAFSIASIVSVHWYGIMYMTGLLSAWFALHLLAKRHASRFSVSDVEDLITWVIIGVIIGSRLGYAVFYDLDHYLANPFDIFKVWRGGMSFHGGFLGVIVALFFWGYKHRKNFLDLTDFIAPAVPIGLFFGRIGNFINGELWGTESTLPWAIIFPNGGHIARHPTQLYEALLEGFVLFLILWILSKKHRTSGLLSGVFCIFYASFRIFCEFFRVPDPQYGYFYEYFTMGQILSLPMLLLGIILIVRAKRLQNNPDIDIHILSDGTVLHIKRKTD